MKRNSSIFVASSEGAKYYSYLVKHDSLILIMLQKKKKKNLICSLLGFFVLQLKGAIFRITIQDRNVSVVTENRL